MGYYVRNKQGKILKVPVKDWGKYVCEKDPVKVVSKICSLASCISISTINYALCKIERIAFMKNNEFQEFWCVDFAFYEMSAKMNVE